MARYRPRCLLGHIQSAHINLVARGHSAWPICHSSVKVGTIPTTVPKHLHPSYVFYSLRQAEPNWLEVNVCQNSEVIFHFASVLYYRTLSTLARP